MGRHRPNLRNIAGFAICTVFAVFSIVRESLDTSSVLQYLSDTRPSYSAIHSPPRSLLKELESIDLYSTRDGNVTIFPRVLVLSALDIPPSAILQSTTHESDQKNTKNIPTEQNSVLSTNIQENSRMEMSESLSIYVDDHIYRTFEREWYEDCEEVTKMSNSNSRDDESTSTARSTCNIFHELGIVEAYSSIEDDNDDNDDKHATGRSHMDLLGVGSWRSVWKLVTGFVKTPKLNVEPDLVLKLLHTHRDFDENSFSIHQIDAIVMDALSASKYVVDSFGFCGQSVITEAATGSGRSLIKNSTLSSMDRLRIARDLARGLADLHALQAHPWNNTKGDFDLPLVFSHHDVNPANLVSVGNGDIRWNDFNLGLVNRQYKISQNDESIHKSNKITECPVPIRYEQLLWRSPEECRNSTGTLFLDIKNIGRNTASQAADVYSLGNILFYVLARHQPWSHLENNSTKLQSGSTPESKRESLLQIAKAKIDGQLPNLPERYRKRPGAKILWEAVQMCYTHDPKLRPSARGIAEFLGLGYERLVRASAKKAKKHKDKKSSNSVRTEAVGE